MNALVIGPEERKLILSLKSYAMIAPIVAAEAVKDARRDRIAYDKLMGTYTIQLATNYQVTYTHEIQPTGKFHHISVSTKSGNLPNEYAVIMICEEFGMKDQNLDIRKFTEMSMGWVEEAFNGRKAVNVLVPFTTEKT